MRNHAAYLASLLVSAVVERARHLVLVGLMGAGKTTVGRRCAERLGRPFVDTDELVEADGGRDASPRSSRPRARRRSARCERAGGRRRVRVARAARDRVRRRRGARRREPARAARRGFVVWLAAPPDVLAARVERDGTATRPLLAGGDRRPRRSSGSRAPRAAPYEAAAHVVVDTDGRDRRRGRRRGARGVPRRDASARERRPVASTPPYDVVVGAGALAEVGRAARPGAGASRS